MAGRRHPGRGRFELKWPNDVLADGAKLAGILLESAQLDGGRYALAIGIGVNVVAHPEGLPYPATSLAALGADVDAETLFLALSDAWTANARDWDEGRGLARIRKNWLARAAGLGSDVAVRVDGNVVRGVFETIDDDCRFVIRAQRRRNDKNCRRRRAFRRGRFGRCCMSSAGKVCLMANMQGPELVFVPLGGVGEIGMNFALYGYGPADRREWVIVDCGVTFPTPELPGVDLVLPDIRFIEENLREPQGHRHHPRA